MTDGQDTDEYYRLATLLRGQVERLGKYISDRRFKDIMVQGWTKDYTEVKMVMYRDTKIGLEEIQSTMQSMFLDDVATNGTATKTRGGSLGVQRL